MCTGAFACLYKELNILCSYWISIYEGSDQHLVIFIHYLCTLSLHEHPFLYCAVLDLLRHDHHLRHDEASSASHFHLIFFFNFRSENIITEQQYFLTNRQTHLKALRRCEIHMPSHCEWLNVLTSAHFICFTTSPHSLRFLSLSFMRSLYSGRR